MGAIELCVWFGLLAAVLTVPVVFVRVFGPTEDLPSDE